MTAGQGMRLRPFTDDRPKGMVKIAGLPLLAYSIAVSRACGASRIIVVGGYKSETVVEFLKKNAPEITFLKNNEITKGNLSTLMTALPHIDDSFLLLNADHVYKSDVVPKIIAQLHEITAFCDTDRALAGDDMKVCAENGAIKTISKQLTDYTHGYVGITYVHTSMLPLYRFTAEELFRESDGTTAVEAILARIAAQNIHVKIGDISNVGWFEIDTPEELVTAENYITHHKNEFLTPIERVSTHAYSSTIAALKVS